jgi:DNA-binding MarR family transcriptional regulator
MKLSDADYERLLAFRLGLRRFLHWSEEQVAEVGLTPTQHQLLLVVRGSEGDGGPTIREVSEALLLKHHSAVELVDRAEHAGYVTRARYDHDRRVVRVALTKKGRDVLEGLSRRHLRELHLLAPALEGLLDSVNAA